jgi:manganese/zinc/iron transport system permease protein
MHNPIRQSFSEFSWAWQVDGWMILASILCGIACALVGNFLVLRRLSLIGDAISHAVLPGIAAGFLLFANRSPWIALVGAALVGVLTVWLIELVKHLSRIEESAAIGVVFTALFALGIVLVSQTEHVDLDPSCVLYGNLETIILQTVETPFGSIPSVVLELAAVCLFNTLAIWILSKWWILSTFDPILAAAQGIPVARMRYLLAAMVAMVCVLSFRAVGNILVVAMLIVPPATAWLLSNRISTMFLLSILTTVLSSILGHLAAITLPHLVGFKSANSAAMVATTSGILLILAIILSPKTGLLWKWFQQRSLNRRILAEDILALFYRQAESSESTETTIPFPTLTTNLIATKLQRSHHSILNALQELVTKHWITSEKSTSTPSGWELTDEGFRQAQEMVRTHRLWEHFLYEETKLSDPRLHANAESLEHFTSEELRESLSQRAGDSTRDPHGKEIPPKKP